MASIEKYTTKSKGTLWKVSYRKPDGTPTTKRGFKKKGEAAAWAASNTVHVNSGTWIDPKAGNKTVSDVAEQWKDRIQLLSPSTQNNYLTMWENHVEPQFGSRRVGSLKPSEIQSWVSTMPYSASWVRNCHNVLRQILEIARKDRLIPDNPANALKLPRKTKNINVYLTIEQLIELSKECKNHSEIVLVLGTVGLRWGELAALRPQDLDPKNGRIYVRRNVTWLEREKRWHYKDTLKNHERRTVACPAFVMKQVLKVAKTRKRDELIWQSRDGGPLRTPGHKTWFAGAVIRMVEKSERAIEDARKNGTPEPFPFERVTPHGLRHVAAGLLVQAGANVKSIQMQLGHKDAAETLNTYAELFNDGLKDVADTLDRMFEQSRDVSLSSRCHGGARSGVLAA